MLDNLKFPVDLCKCSSHRYLVNVIKLQLSNYHYLCIKSYH